MGYHKDERGCRFYTPDNDENTLYIQSEPKWSFSQILEEIKLHFGEDSTFEQFKISSEKIHTDYLGYDCYDSSDYTDYLIIERIQ